MGSVAQMVSRLETAVIALRQRRPSQARGVGPKGDNYGYALGASADSGMGFWCSACCVCGDLGT